MKKKHNTFKLLILTLFLVIVICITPRTFSRYETNVTGNTKVETAFYVLKTDYQYQTITLPTMVPREEPYTYTFSISNNKDGKRLETRLVYNISIRTTTNLPLTYELYKNEEDITDATSIKDTDDITKDEDGTYFRIITTNREYFSYLYDETNIYTLVITFPSEYNSAQYQDITEFIEITIDSKQIIDED